MSRSLGWSGLVHAGLLFGLGLGWGVYPDSPPTLNMVFVDPGDAAAEVSPDTPHSALGNAYASVELLPKSFEAPSRAVASADSAEGTPGPDTSAALPREVFMTTDERDAVFAPYLRQWSHAIERLGSRHAPKARDGGRLYGSLVLDVVLDGSGAVHEVRLLRPSGEPLLDDGAKRIVELAAPFKPFTEAMLAETDRLHIIRTWRFEPGPRLAPPPADDE